MTTEAMLEILADDELREGTVVARRYRLDRVVGEGGMGVVWAATHVLTGKACALKFLKHARAAEPRAHERMLNEARAACAIRHPNVASVHDILELPNGLPFIVMDLLDGESLSRRLATRPLLQAQTFAILEATASGIAAAHAEGVIHRDIKPDNVFLQHGAEGRDVVFVLDFGIAKQTSDPAPNAGDRLGAEAHRARSTDPKAPAPPLTTTCSALGTPLYMAPEQLRGARDVDGRADVFALGMIAYQCATGALPSRGEDAEPGVDRTAVKAALAVVTPSLPPSFIDLVVGMLAHERADRPSMTEVQKALQDLRANTANARKPTRARAFGPWIGAAVAGAVIVLLAKLSPVTTASRPSPQATGAPTVVETVPPSSTVVPTATSTTANTTSVLPASAPPPAKSVSIALSAPPVKPSAEVLPTTTATTITSIPALERTIHTADAGGESIPSHERR